MKLFVAAIAAVAIAGATAQIAVGQLGDMSWSTTIATAVITAAGAITAGWLAWRTS